MRALDPATVIEHLAFETPFTPAQITGHNGRGSYLGEVRAAAALLVTHLCDLTDVAFGRVFGRSGEAGRRLVQSALGLALRDGELEALIDRVAGTLRAIGDEA